MIAELLKKGKQTLSFEVFPPKKEEVAKSIFIETEIYLQH